MVEPLEFTFKRVGGLEIKLDVYLPSGCSRANPAPVCIWWHGGGLFQGTRKRIPPHLLKLPESGIALISPDYRLAPQANVYLILEDAQAAVQFVRNDLVSLLESRIDPDRLALTGGSAGGWLALLAGIPSTMPGSLSSPPTCIAALYPMVDVDVPFYTTAQRPVPWMNDLIPLSTIATDIDPQGPVITSSTKQDTRALVCDYVTQASPLLPGTLVKLTIWEGIWHDLCFANASSQSPQSSASAGDISITPRIWALSKKGGRCPPVWVTSGSVDLCIDPLGVENMVRLMEGYRMEVEWELRQGRGHSFDFEDGEEVDGLGRFLEKHLL